MPLDFKDLVVIITGGGGGLGRAYAHMYARGKAKVVINDVSQANADKVVAEVKKREYAASSPFCVCRFGCRRAARCASPRQHPCKLPGGPG